MQNTIHSNPLLILNTTINFKKWGFFWKKAQNSATIQFKDSTINIENQTNLIIPYKDIIFIELYDHYKHFALAFKPTYVLIGFINNNQKKQLKLTTLQVKDLVNISTILHTKIDNYIIHEK